MGLDRKKSIAYLRRTLALDDPNIEDDEAYKFSENDLWEILKYACSAHNPAFTFDNFPENQFQFAILLARREVYYTLAGASAPYYPLEAEGAKLRKDVRFDHYEKLIRLVTNQYELAVKHYNSVGGTILTSVPGEDGISSVGDLILRDYHYTQRNIDLFIKPKVALKVTKYYIQPNKVILELEWDKFKTSGGIFKSYTLMYAVNPVYDRFTNEISKDAINAYSSNDIHRNLFRLVLEDEYIEDLNNTFIGVASKDINGLNGYEEFSVQELIERYNIKKAEESEEYIEVLDVTIDIPKETSGLLSVTLTDYKSKYSTSTLITKEDDEFKFMIDLVSKLNTTCPEYIFTSKDAILSIQSKKGLPIDIQFDYQFKEIGE